MTEIKENLDYDKLFKRALEDKYDGKKLITLTKEEYIYLSIKGLIQESEGLGKFCGLEIVKK